MMVQKKTSVKTKFASKYLQQLCKHWSHRFEVEFDTNNGRVEFGEGIIFSAVASDETLTLIVETHDDGEIEKFQTVVVSHLNRFAFREELEYDWQ